jgi:hypothetical protein
VTLPGADELFRATSAGRDRAPEPATQAREEREPTPLRRRPVPVAGDAPRRPTGREKHDEKITVYVSPAELLDLERARLALRAEHGLGVDRGRIVREAVAVVIADLEAKGEDSILVRRLRGA